MKKEEYFCFVFGEGKKDKKFFMALKNLEKFKYHTKKWHFDCDNGSGSSAEDILKKCKRIVSGLSYHLVLCFIDLDDLKNDFPTNWEKKKKMLEEKYSDYKIIWQLDNAEDEYKRVLGGQYMSKHELNKAAQKRINEFINSDLWKRILSPIQDKEKELKNEQ